MEREVNNSGFSQYFFNSSGDFTKETLNALNTIGSRIVLEIFESAVNNLSDGIVLINRDERQEILDKLEKKDEELCDEMNNKFYKYEEDIYELMMKYIKENINDFR